MPERPAFQPPRSVAEAMAQRAVLGQTILDIQSQLQDGQPPRQDGRAMTPEEYIVWRRRATDALAWRRRELAVVKEYLSAHAAVTGGAPGDKLRRRHLSREVYRAILEALLALLVGGDDQKLMAVEGASCALNAIDADSAADDRAGDRNGEDCPEVSRG